MTIVRLSFVLALIAAVHFLGVHVEGERLIREEMAARERALQDAFDETSYQGNRDPKTRRFFPGYADADRSLNLDVFIDGKWQVEAGLDHAAHYRKQIEIAGRGR